MIWESRYWKIDLLKIANKLKLRREQKRWTDASLGNAEKEIMISAFIIRKLIDSRKIDLRMDRKLYPVSYYNSNGKEFRYLNRLSPEKFFNLEKGKMEKIKIHDLLNLIIHSYFFMLIFSDNKLDRFWVASDKYKKVKLFEFEIHHYIEILEIFGNYWPVAEGYYLNKGGDDLLVDHTNDEALFNKYFRNEDINNSD